MATIRSKDGTSIAFNKMGSGEPLILVGGALCSRAFGPTNKMARLLTPHFTVFNYDRRGRNESGNTEPYSVDREIEDIEALIKEAGGAAFVTGFSSGAALTLRAAASGANIKKMVLYEPPYVMNMGGYNPPADSEAQLKTFIASGQRSDAVTFFMKDMVGMPSIFPFIMRFTPMWSKLKAVAHTLPYDAAIMSGFSLPASIAASVTIPTLVVGGEKSVVTLRNAVKQVAENIPNAESTFLKGQAHDVSAKAIVPVLINYFKK